MNRITKHSILIAIICITFGYAYPTFASNITWAATGSLNEARSDHTATLLTSGKVLVTGGIANGVDIATTELYDPNTGTWSYTGSMNEARYGHTATLLSDGKILVEGGR